MALRVVTGFEFGATSGWTVGNNGNRIVDAVTGTPAIITTAPRTGTYCLEIDTTSAAESVAWDDNTLGGSQTFGRCVFAIRFPSLSGGDIVLAQWRSSASPGQFLYIQSDNRFAAIISGGTLQLGGPTLATNTWYHIELYYDVSTSTNKIDWLVDGVAQTQATKADATGNVQDFQLGASTFSQTFNARYDDVVVYTDTSAISLIGAHKVQPLLVDTGGTVSTLGATSDFQTFSGATPTLTAWNATTARGNIDELPVNTGSAQDGIAQINTASTNAVEVPMTSYTLAAGETVAGLVIRVAGWQQDTTSGTIGVRSFNGTTETTLLAAQAHTNLANNSADPGWICRVATTADFDTQGEIDALTVRVGFSDDAAPDIGFGAIYGELAVKEATAATSIPYNPQRSLQYRDQSETQWIQKDRRNALLVAAAVNDLAAPLLAPEHQWSVYSHSSLRDRRLVPQQRTYYDLPSAPVADVLASNPPETYTERRVVPRQRTYTDPSLLLTAQLENELLGGADTAKRYLTPATHADRREVPQQRQYFDLTLLTTAQLEGALLGGADTARHQQAALYVDRREVPQQRPYVSDPSFYPTQTPTDPLTVAWGVGGHYWLLYNQAAMYVDRREVPQQREYESDPSLLLTALLEGPLLVDDGRHRQFSTRPRWAQQLAPYPVPAAAADDPLTLAAGVGGDIWRHYNIPATHVDRRAVPQQPQRETLYFDAGPGSPPLTLAWGVGGHYWHLYNHAAGLYVRAWQPHQPIWAYGLAEVFTGVFGEVHGPLPQLPGAAAPPGVVGIVGGIT